MDWPGQEDRKIRVCDRLNACLPCHRQVLHHEHSWIQRHDHTRHQIYITEEESAHRSHYCTPPCLCQVYSQNTRPWSSQKCLRYRPSVYKRASRGHEANATSWHQRASAPNCAIGLAPDEAPPRACPHRYRPEAIKQSTNMLRHADVAFLRVTSARTRHPAVVIMYMLQGTLAGPSC